MSSPSASGVVRRRSVKTCVGVSRQSGTRKGSRQLDVRVNTTRLRSSGDTAVAPSNSSDATSIESCSATAAGRDAGTSPDWASTAAHGVTTSDAARRQRRRREKIRTDGGSNRVAPADGAKSGPRSQAMSPLGLTSLQRQAVDQHDSRSTGAPSCSYGLADRGGAVNLVYRRSFFTPTLGTHARSCIRARFTRDDEGPGHDDDRSTSERTEVRERAWEAAHRRPLGRLRGGRVLRDPRPVDG